jgi:hypothetical protein
MKQPQSSDAPLAKLVLRLDSACKKKSIAINE